MQNKIFMRRAMQPRTVLVRFVCAAVWLLVVFPGCRSERTGSLTVARQAFKTTLTPSAAPRDPLDQAPPDVFLTLTYPAPSGPMATYLSPNPGDGVKHPAIIWITGGDCNSIGDVWTRKSRDNEQSASAYRKAGIIMMFPSLRGGNTNPGIKEGFLGEVDDVLAALQFLQTQPYVDPARIYLGGHSTGGTLALLVAESTNQFRGVFSFGPIDDVSNYGPDTDFLPFNISNREEVEIRSPIYWLHNIQCPVWVIEGTIRSNIGPLHAMARASKNPKAHFIAIHGASHFATLAPTNELIARKILQDTGETTNLALTEIEVNANYAR